MKKVIEILNRLRNTSSTNDKLSILKSQTDNELLQKVLKYTYDDSLKYGITEDVISPYIKENNPYSGNMFDLFDKLAASNINDDLRRETGIMLGSLQPSERELALQILTKDLKCNISSKTIQKVWKDLIPKWEVQQAFPIDKYKLKKGEWIAISEKLNGSRGSFINGEIKSRQNKVFNGLEHIIKDIKLLHMDDWFIDGELIRNNYDNISDNENFRLSMSIINSDTEDKSDIIFRIYDILPMNEFLQGESKLKYPDRIKQLQDLSDTIQELSVEQGRKLSIEVLPILYQGTDRSQIEKWLKWADDNGKEGCMLYRNSTYKCKRHNGILKVKSFKHCDVLCKSIYEGTGKYKGMLGGIIVNYKGYDCGCGSGLTDEQRKYYHEHPEDIVGKIVQIKFKEESKNKDGGLSMQFPIFECVRNDKDEESYN